MLISPVALVTGPGRGLGKHLSLRLAEAGYSVAVHYRSGRDQAEAHVQEMIKMGHQAFAVGGALEEEAEAIRTVEEVIEKWGRLDLLIHNGGHYEPTHFLELSAADWRKGFSSTIDAGFFTSRAALPHLRKSRSGRMILIGDSSCERPGARDLSLSYHIGKTGILMLTRSLAVSEAPFGITVNCVSPGFLDTSVGLPPLTEMPSGRFGTQDDIWKTIHWLIGPESQYVNGAHIVVSGGWNLR